VSINTYAVVFFGFPVGPEDVPYKTQELWGKIRETNLKGVMTVEYGPYDKTSTAFAITDSYRYFDLDDRPPIQPIPLQENPFLPVRWAEILKEAAKALGIGVSSEPQWYFTAQQG